MAYFDTSVLAACYVPEANSKRAQEAMSRDRRVVISSLVEAEMASALSRRVRTGELFAGNAREVLDRFGLHVAAGVFDVLPVGVREFRMARDWMARFDTPLKTLDALHLAVAFCNGLSLVTADASLARCAATMGVKAEVI